jgi:hypothetical protein
MEGGSYMDRIHGHSNKVQVYYPPQAPHAAERPGSAGKPPKAAKQAPAAIVDQGRVDNIRTQAQVAAPSGPEDVGQAVDSALALINSGAEPPFDFNQQGVLTVLNGEEPLAGLPVLQEEPAEYPAEMYRGMETPPENAQVPVPQGGTVVAASTAEGTVGAGKKDKARTSDSGYTVSGNNAWGVLR